MMTPALRHFLPAALAALILLASPALAQTIWTGGGGTSAWNNAANWSTGVVPTSGQDVVIDLDGAQVQLNVEVSLASLTVGAEEAAVTLTMTGSSMTLAGNSTVLAGSTLKHQGGNVTIGAGAEFDIAGDYERTTGSGFIGSGTLKLSGTATLGGGGILNNQAVTIAGEASVTSEVHFNGPVTVADGGSLLLPNDQWLRNWSNGSVTIQAGGLLEKSSGSGTAQSQVAVTNGGIVRVVEGTFTLVGGGSATGTFEVEDGATLRITSGAYTLNAGASFEGDGTVVFDGSVTVAASLSMSGLTHSGGTVTINAGQELEVTGAYTRTGGAQFSGSGTLKLSGTATLGGGSTLNNQAVTIAGEASVTSEVHFNGPVTVADGGSLLLPNDQWLRNWSNGSVTIQAGGLLEKSSGSGTAQSQVAVTNGGIVRVVEGTFTLVGGGSATGTFEVEDGATLRIAGGAYTLNAGASFEGDGTVLFDGPVTVAASLSMSGLTHQSNTVTINAGQELEVTGAYTRTGGAQFSGSGTLKLSGTATLGGGGTLNNQAVTIAGEASVTSEVHFNGPVTVADGGSLLLPNDQWLRNWSNGSVTVQQGGRLVKTSGTGTSHLNLVVTVAGELAVLEGTLRPGSQLHVQSTGVLSGTGTLDLTGVTVGSSFTNAGGARPGDPVGLLKVTGNYTGQRLEIDLTGPAPGTGYDQLQVSGQGAAAGTLAVSVGGLFQPQIGDAFTVMTCGTSCTGGFTAVEATEGYEFDVAVSGGTVVATVTNVPPSFEITAPAEGAVVRVGSSLRVTWTGPGVPNTDAWVLVSLRAG